MDSKGASVLGYNENNAVHAVSTTNTFGVLQTYMYVKQYVCIYFRLLLYIWPQWTNKPSKKDCSTFVDDVSTQNSGYVVDIFCIKIVFYIFFARKIFRN